VDVGLGKGPTEYLDILLHSFPSNIDPEVAFEPASATRAELPAAYVNEIDRQVKQGVDEGDATCGMTEIHGISVAAAFVGATASTLALADILRLLHSGTHYSVMALDLREPDRCDAVRNPQKSPAINVGFVDARPQ
jgi:hypothetical protein